VVPLKNQSNGSQERVIFARIPSVIETPDLLNVQIDSFNNFLQADTLPHRRKKLGLQQVFEMNFPISDARENFLLEFEEYYVEKPKYSVIECQERGLTFAVPLKAKLRRERICRYNRTGGLSRQPPCNDTSGHIYHQRRGTCRCQPASSFAWSIFR
jgi:DNA-directed RNA polymerase beta subunit